VVEEYLARLSPQHPQAQAYAKDLREMEAYCADREKNWQDMYFTPSADPSTQLVLVIEGRR
jgi:hypothetical protein